MFEKFLKCVTECFPEEITIEVNGSNYILQRSILAIDGPENTVVDKTKYLNRIKFKSDDKKITDSLLKTYLDILDKNLGKKYESASKEMYENNRPWTANKLEEMNSEGLIYVGYWRDDAPLVFLSFMLTEEQELEKGDVDSISSVVFLYEIQLSSQVQRIGLGKKMLGEFLKNCCKKFVTDHGANLEYEFAGIELTVFSDNVAALSLYNSLGMEKTLNSPMDKVVSIQPRRNTRSNAKKNSISTQSQKKMIKKPLYYLYWMKI